MQSYTFKSEFTTNFEYIKAKTSETHKLTIIYLHGLCSDPWGRKPESLKSYCEQHNLGFLRYELVGHGSDSAHYAQADLNIWRDQLLEVIDDIVQGDILLVGMSVGGWLALLAGVLRPQRIKAILGISAAPDFANILYDQYMTAEQKIELKTTGQVGFATKDFTYIFTQGLFASAQENCLLQAPIPIDCPVHLLQGMQDANYPWQNTPQIAQLLTSRQVMVKLLKDSSHRMQQPGDVAEMFRSLDSLLSSPQIV